MHEREEIRQLFERYKQGKCTPEERVRLHAWFNRYAAREASGLDDLQASFASRYTGRRKFLRWLPYAAAVVLVAGVSIGLYVSDGQKTSADKFVVEDIAPGGNRATLTLADGRVVDLSSKQAGIIIANGITYLDGSTVSPEVGKSENPEGRRFDMEKGSLTTDYYVLNTPRGGTYQVTLPDGTRVWLNAASTLKYPSRFEGRERVVEIEGEGYFSVAKDAERPFRVISRVQEIEVLGTEFNISAYGDENTVTTTLVNGTIAVRNPASNRVAKLSPGQQSTIKGSETLVGQVETSLYTSWRKGVFSFKRTPAQDVMKQLARWYDVEVVYSDGNPPAITFSGEMGRDVSLRTVLEFLELSGIAFRLEGRKLNIE
ncbi:iron dicitrate transporter FecR [Parapedobacter pyrenivorans]|uniref:Iron dicitrate transporter FecR n=1 Tax=Parapedobacter pyrenivorans TaxID=1305674 RepID=A0A917M4H6_9SPHI|nr:FecR family protein [Parapedobacter pyrenivorans]GGG76786.1 iron dicitrate transporter FecR [Parapedobacter pyrenivorans]